MMLRSTILLAGVLGLASCTVVQQSADVIAREEARRVVNAQVQQIAPGTNATLLTDCIINNASAQEILIIAAGASGVQTGASNTIATILQRPAVTQCAARAVLAGLV